MPLYTPEIQYMNLGDIFGKVAGIQNARFANRLNAMQIAEAEKKMAREAKREALSRSYLTPAQPAQTIKPEMSEFMPSYTDNPLAANYLRPPVEVPGRPASFDMPGYQKALYEAGDVEGAMAAGKSIEETAKNKIDIDVKQQEMVRKNIELLGNAAFGLMNEYNRRVSTGMLDAQARAEIQPLYMQTLDYLSRNGLNMGQASMQFDPNQVMTVANMALDIKERKQMEDTARQEKRLAIMDEREARRAEERDRTLALQEKRLTLAEDKESRKEEIATKKEEMKTEEANEKADIIINKVDEAVGKAGFWTTGLIGDLRSTLPGRMTGGGAYDLEKTIDTIKAIISFQELADMRAASPTGGALGQIAVRELELLQAARASLEKGQSEEQLLKNLLAVKTHYQNWKDTMEKARGMASTQSQPPTVPMKSMPDPRQHKGRIVKDTETGTRWQSDGTTWRTLR